AGSVPPRCPGSWGCAAGLTNSAAAGGPGAPVPEPTGLAPGDPPPPYEPYRPPETWITSPVMYSASSLARKAATPATSSGFPRRGIGSVGATRSTSVWKCGSEVSPGVAITPGAMQLTVTPNFPSSSASDRDRPITPALDAE